MTAVTARPLRQMTTQEAIEAIEARAAQLVRMPRSNQDPTPYIVAAEICWALCDVLRGGFTR